MVALAYILRNKSFDGEIHYSLGDIGYELSALMGQVSLDKMSISVPSIGTKFDNPSYPYQKLRQWTEKLNTTCLSMF